MKQWSVQCEFSMDSLQKVSWTANLLLPKRFNWCFRDPATKLTGRMLPCDISQPSFPQNVWTISIQTFFKIADSVPYHQELSSNWVFPIERWPYVSFSFFCFSSGPQKLPSSTERLWLVNLPPPNVPEVAGLMIRAYEKLWVSLKKAGY